MAPAVRRGELPRSVGWVLAGDALFTAAFLILLVALAVAVAAPAMARPKPPKTEAAVAAAMQPTAPPTREALAMLDAAIADGRLENARALLAPMWASGVPDVLLRAAELALAGGSLPEAAEAFTRLTDGPLAAVARQGLGIIRLRDFFSGGTQNSSGDMLSQARVALGMQRSLDNVAYREAHGSIPPTSTVTTRQALEWVTVEGVGEGV